MPNTRVKIHCVLRTQSFKTKKYDISNISTIETSNLNWSVIIFRVLNGLGCNMTRLIINGIKNNYIGMVGMSMDSKFKLDDDGIYDFLNNLINR